MPNPFGKLKLSSKMVRSTAVGRLKPVSIWSFQKLFAVGYSVWDTSRFLLLVAALTPLIVILSISVALTDDKSRD